MDRGIRSTGLKAALGIAQLTLELAGLPRRAVARRTLAPVPNLAEHLARDWQQPGADEIVCHCERVTRREIDACLDDAISVALGGGHAPCLDAARAFSARQGLSSS
jgi:glycerol-3-phosphate dehydrogenase